MLNWQSLVFILPGLLAYTWPGDNKSSGHNELFLLGMHNHTAWGMTLWQDNAYKLDSFCLLWFRELQSSQCPFVKLLVHCVIALPLYNLLLILIGSATSSAERMLLVSRLVSQRPVTASPVALPPLPPPRCKRRSAPKAPSNRMRCSLNPPDKYPSQKDPFSSVDHSEQYKNLRRNLMRVLEGLQQPVPAISQLPMPLPMPMPVAMPASKPLFNPREPIASEPIQSPSLDESKAKKKSRKWFQKVAKRLGKPFAKNKNHDQVQEDSEVTPSNSSGSSNKNSSIIQMGWKRLKIRASRRSQFYVPSASSSETISSASCIYAY
ncbi:hypothetical protein ACLKA6_011871 [Drosophila palustris]